MTDKERFWVKVDKSGDCWEWIAFRLKSGYGRFWYKGAPHQAHRVSWMLHNLSEIPKGQCVLHRCDNPPCVNPDHLFLGTDADNVRDRDQKGRQNNMQKTHCFQGHPYSGDNLHILPNGDRRCRVCHASRERTYRERKKNERL